MTSAVATILGVLVGIAIGRIWRSDTRSIYEIDLTQRRAGLKDRRRLRDRR